MPSHTRIAHVGMTFASPGRSVGIGCSRRCCEHQRIAARASGEAAVAPPPAARAAAAGCDAGLP
eukprot:2705779-Pyramimonas_sp.AAC.1